MVANDSLSGEYGRVRPGDHFHASEEVALGLEARGLAYRYRVAGPSENKVVFPSSNKKKSPKDAL